MYEKPPKLPDGTFMKNKITLCKMKSMRHAIKKPKKVFSGNATLGIDKFPMC